ncbi:MAG TPA: Smr/MutS family protein [Thermodesulfobacteriota bacterium]|nr:Smr/MutS family protein [Thermodesulfobacteriota bacterium]
MEGSIAMPPDFTSDEPTELPLEDSLDLHTFQPREIPSLLAEYLAACVSAGFYTVRIIHGKGTGVLRERVHATLRASRLVESFSLCDETSGGWGATFVQLRTHSEQQ